MMSKQNQGYPLYFKGNPKVLDLLRLSLTTTLNLPKPIPVHVPFAPKLKEITPLLDPIINVEVLDDSARELVMRGKYSLKPATFYVYFPSEFRVDEKIYKSFFKNYENLIDELPRSVKPNVQKLIIWEEGKNEHSVDHQVTKINEALSELTKELVQLKIVSMSGEIKQQQSQPPTPKSLMHVYLLKNKLATLYSHLRLYSFASDLLADVWNQVLVNFRCIMKLPPARTANPRIDCPIDAPRAPYTFTSADTVLGQFQNSECSAYLRIATHTFLNFYAFNVRQGNFHFAMGKLKYFIDFVLSNVLVLNNNPEWEQQQKVMFEISRNLWMVEVIFRCLREVNLRIKESELDVGFVFENRDEFYRVHVSICSMLRNSTERIGFLLYDFDNFGIFPNSLSQDLTFIYDKLLKLRYPEKIAKLSINSVNSANEDESPARTSSLAKRKAILLEIPQVGPKGLRIRELIHQKQTPSVQISKLLISNGTFNQVYLQVLKTMHQSLQQSSYPRLGRSLKLTWERATILLGDWQQLVDFSQHFNSLTCNWASFKALQSLYHLFFYYIWYVSGLVTVETICRHIVSMITNELLIEHEEKVLRIVLLMQQHIESTQSRYTVGQLEQMHLDEANCLIFTVRNSRFHRMFKQNVELQLVTEQVMLGEGIKKYKLHDMQIQFFSRCGKCPRQCGMVCLEQGQRYTRIKCRLAISDNERSTFYPKEIIVQKQIEDKVITFHLDLPRLSTSTLYQVNTPKFRWVHAEADAVYSEMWTPYCLDLGHFYDDVRVDKVEAVMQDCYDGVEVEPEETGINGKQEAEITGQILKRNKNQIVVSHQVCLITGQNEKEYYKLGSSIHKKIAKNSPNCQVVVFLKSNHPISKITRNSKHSPSPIQTHSALLATLTLSLPDSNKHFKLCCRSRALSLAPLLQISYLNVQTFEQFTVTNLQPLLVTALRPPHSYPLGQHQQLSTSSRTLCLHPSAYPQLQVQINFSTWFDDDHLLQQASNTCRLWYEQQHGYECYKPIQVQSEVLGRVQLPGLDQAEGYEVVGRVEGELRRQGAGVDLWVVPTRPGNIVLPELWVDGKKGIWVNSLITGITRVD